jgi:uncharacterized protein YndB with AHSA1/START domain
MTTYPVRHLSLTIEKPYTQVYAFLANPDNFAQWAHGLGTSFHHAGGHNWQAETPSGPMTVSFPTPNPYGIVDHTVHPADDSPATYVPMRVLINGTGTEILFTLFQKPGVTDRTFTTDAETVMLDLHRLKSLLENQPSARLTA